MSAEQPMDAPTSPPTGPICSMPPDWCYVIDTGDLYLSGAHVGRGYAGMGPGKNNPAMCNVHNVGPIPPGKYTICGPPFTHPTAGLYCMRLEPKLDTDMLGREPHSFMMHGDNPTGTASEGCIVQKRPAREAVWASGNRDLTVITSVDQP